MLPLKISLHDTLINMCVRRPSSWAVKMAHIFTFLERGDRWFSVDLPPVSSAAGSQFGIQMNLTQRESEKGHRTGPLRVVDFCRLLLTAV
jgi:hypothetical protein